jgi:hypothetical protein
MAIAKVIAATGIGIATYKIYRVSIDRITLKRSGIEIGV